MSQGGAEREKLLSHPLADRLRDVVEDFGGEGEIADILLTRFDHLEEDDDGILIGDILRDADYENGIGHSSVRLEFNPHTKGLRSSVFLGGLVKRILSLDILDRVTRIHTPEKGIVIFENDKDRMVWLDRNNKLIATPS